MKKIVRITESDIEQLVKKIIKEDIQNNQLYLDLNKVISNSNSSRDEIMKVLEYMIDEREKSNQMRSRMLSRGGM